jgi:ribosomal RNA-processing protein 1
MGVPADGATSPAAVKAKAAAAFGSPVVEAVAVSAAPHSVAKAAVISSQQLKSALKAPKPTASLAVAEREQQRVVVAPVALVASSSKPGRSSTSSSTPGEREGGSSRPGSSSGHKQQQKSAVGAKSAAAAAATSAKKRVKIDLKQNLYHAFGGPVPHPDVRTPSRVQGGILKAAAAAAAGAAPSSAPAKVGGGGGAAIGMDASRAGSASVGKQARPVVSAGKTPPRARAALFF